MRHEHAGARARRLRGARQTLADGDVGQPPLDLGAEFVVGHWARGEELLGESLVLTTYESTSRPASRRP